MKKGMKMLIAASLGIVAVAPTAVTTASAAETPLQDGIYVGGSVNKFYTVSEFVGFSAAKQVEILSSASLDNIKYVFNGKVASLTAMSANGLNALQTYKSGDLNASYTGTNGTVTPPATPANGELSVESVSAINATTVTAKLATAKTGLVAKDFKVLVDGTEVTPSAVVADATGANYTLTVAGLEGKAGKVSVNGTEVAYNFEAPKVASVSAINAKQVLVKFGQEVDVESAEDEQNYDVITVVGYKYNPVDDAQVQADGKSVLLTLNDEYRVSTDINVTVDNVYLKGSIKKVFPKFSKVITVNDTTAPSIADVKSATSTSTAQDITVELSEPITTGTFLVNGKVVAVNPTPVNAAGTKFAFGNLSLAAGSTNTVEIVNAVDYAENKAASVTKTFTVTKDNTPAVATVTVLDDNKIQLSFNKAVTTASVKAADNVTLLDEDMKKINDVSINPVTEGATSAKEFIITLDSAANLFVGPNDQSEDVQVRVSPSVVDTLGNSVTGGQFTEFHKTVILTEDVAGPVLKDVTFDKNSKGEVTKLYFAFDEVLDQSSIDALNLNGLNLNVKDLRTNESVTLWELGLDNFTVTLASDKKTVIVTPATPTIKSGNYSFEVQEGFVRDDSSNLNHSKKVAKTVNFGEAANEAKVVGYFLNEYQNLRIASTNEEEALFLALAQEAGRLEASFKNPCDPNVATIIFNQPVKTASAKNPANYTIGGKALPAGTEIVVNEFSPGGVFAQVVQFELPEGFVAKSEDGVKVEVKNIQPLDSDATFINYVGVEGVVDNTRPTVKSEIQDNGLVKLTFSEEVIIETDDFNKVRVNGLELPASEYNFKFVRGAQGSSRALDSVTFTVATEISEVVGGKYYRYIDVDGINGYSPSKDIKLAVSNEVPANWATTVNLNDAAITSVEVVTTDTPVTHDLADNTLAPKATITVK